MFNVGNKKTMNVLCDIVYLDRFYAQFVELKQI